MEKSGDDPTVMVAGAVVELPLWAISVEVYAPDTFAVPAAEGVKFTLHDAVPVVPGMRAQLL